MSLFIYSLFIEPLESLMGLILEAAFSLCASWGISLVLLSLAVNIVLIPVYHLAESWQEDERIVQGRMAAKLAEIKAVYRGRERYMFVRALYRLHGYTPIMALRTSLGLLIQIPFFFAAYHLLSHDSALAGHGFLFISDLALPDSLLSVSGHSVNVLPFVMTAVNLLSAAVYTSRLSRRDKIQLYGLALLFLLLLYSAPAALLVYWTCNNIFSFFKNIVYSRYVYNDAGQRPFPLARRIAGILSSPGRLWTEFAAKLPAYADLIPALLGGAAFFFSQSMDKRLTQGHILLAVTIVCFGLATLIRTRRIALRADRDTPAAQLPRLLLLVAVGIFFAKYTTLQTKYLTSPALWLQARLYATSVAALSLWILCREPLFPLLARLAAACEKRLPHHNVFPLFASATLVMAVLIFAYAPAEVYASDVDFFYEFPARLLGRITFLALLFSAICLVALRISPVRLKPFLAVLQSWLALIMVLYEFVATNDYGILDDMFLQNPDQLRTPLAIPVDAAVFLAAGLVLFFLLKKGKTKSLKGMFQSLSLVLAGIACWQLAHLPEPAIDPTQKFNPEPPEYADRLFNFSKRGDNILIVMLDTFTGGHVQEILDKEPQLAQQFEGFVWYPDTLAPGSATVLSIAALLGGEQYTTKAINEQGKQSLVEAMHEGFAILPNIFVPRGYDVVLAGVDHLDPVMMGPVCPYSSQILMMGDDTPYRTAFTDYWREQKGVPAPPGASYSSFLAAVGLFRASPWMLRRQIYADATWLSTQRQGFNPTEGPMAMLDLLPQVSRAEQQKNTLKYISSMATHSPWQLDPLTCMPTDKQGYRTRPDGVIIEHLGSERCALLALGRWMQWMKDNGVYDNSQIIFLSDHGANDSPKIRSFLDNELKASVLWRPHSLLMVKEKNSRGALRVDPRLMSGADLPALICRSNGPCPGFSQADPLVDPLNGAQRKRTFDYGQSNLSRHEKNRFLTKRYVVNGTIFDKRDWKELP